MDKTPRLSPSLDDESRYRLLVEAVTDYAIYMLDRDGIVTSWNPGAQRFKGYTAAEIIGKHFSRFYLDAEREAGFPARNLATAVREGKFEGEGWRIRKDGTRFWAHVVIDPIFDPAGQVIGFAKVTRDLTERKAAEEQLQRSREQFRLLVQGVTDYAIYMLDTDGRITSWNAGAQRFKGYTEEEAIGRHFSLFYRAEDRAQDHPARALETAAREGRFEAEGWRVRKDGTQFWANVVIDPIRDGSGAIVGFAKVTRDVTDKREAQQALERSQESLFQSQKLEAIGQLTGGVAHDFNNLLMVILSSLEIVRRRMGDDPKMKGLVENAIAGARRGATLTQRMLAFARQQNLIPVSTDVAHLVQGMLELLKRSLGPSIEVRVCISPGLHVLVDPNQLELALLNLAVNSRDAMLHSGALTFEAEQVTTPSSRTSLPPGEYVCLSVRDTGPGMDEATLARAREPFFTTKGIGKGTGLGLAMVEGFASQSRGQFVLHSQLGEGTTAELWLPVSESAPQRREETQAAEAATRSLPSLKVLVVDDDHLVLASTVSMLEELHHTAYGADTASEALEILRREPGIQLLLSDQAMPHMTGLELIEAVRQEQPTIAGILATGFADLDHKVPSSVIRLQKPFDQTDLARAIEAASKAASKPPPGQA